MGDLELEVVEEYVLLGQKRFRIRVRGSRLYVNVAASSRDEAISRAREMLERLEAWRVLRRLDEAGEAGG